MVDKQPQLNGAYYGHQIPPAEAPPPRPKKNCFCSVCSFCWKLLLVIMILLVLVFIIFSAVVQPRAFRFFVTDATLTQFNYTSNDNTLRYNLVLNFTTRNPNKKINIYYETVEAHLSYDGKMFASTDVLTRENSFFLRTKSTERMNVVFSGNHVTVLDQDQMEHLEEDEKSRVFIFDLKLYFMIKFKLGHMTFSDTKSKAKCHIEVPLSSKENASMAMATVFLPTHCHVHL